MKKTTKLLLSLCFILTLFACQDNDNEEGVIKTSPVSEGGYRIAMPFESSDATQVHIDFKRSDYDVNAIGKGLQKYAKEHFSPNKYYLQDGQLLDREDLIGGSDSLLDRKSTKNPYGLNPEIDFKLPISDTETIEVGKSTIPVGDIVEYNFLSETGKNAEIEGVAFAVILNEKVVGKDGKDYKIDDEQLKILGEEVARNLMTYVKDKPEISANTPILITLFKAVSDDANLPGVFIAQGYGKNNIGSFSDIDEKWAIIPSENASKLDPQIVSQFDSMKKALFGFLPNDIAIIGKGFFVDNGLDELYITVTTQGKSQIQNESVVQYTKELLNGFSSNSYRIIVKIKANDETYAMFQRERGSNDVQAIME